MKSVSNKDIHWAAPSGNWASVIIWSSSTSSKSCPLKIWFCYNWCFVMYVTGPILFRHITSPFRSVSPISGAW
jgi:hypothetical protein